MMINTLLFVCLIPYVKASTSEEGSGFDDNLINNDENIIWEGSGLSVKSSEQELDDFDLPGLLTTPDQLCEGSVFTKTTRDLILKTHNDLRSLLAYGKQRNKRGTMMPGRNIYKLSWDCDLEKRSRKHIQHCNSTFMGGRDLVSDSHLFKTFWLHWDGRNHIQNIRSAMRMWWNQGKINGNEDDRNRYYAEKKYYGWANMAKGKTTRIGCSYQVCEKEQKATFSCLYNEKAQTEREMIYEPGKPCCTDDDCFTYPDSKCLAAEGLCMVAQRPKDDLKSDMCSENPKMTDVTRLMSLDQHNFYRSRLARGLEYNGETNHSQPQARRMLKMEYDCELEKYAQAWAENCVFAHSDHWERPNQGQNLYMTSFLHSDPRTLMHTGIEKWWQELEEVGVPSHNILSGEMWAEKGKAIGHWTQMAWDRTFRLGCAVVNCTNMGYVVCHYGPAGNRKNQLIYEVGPPCVSDVDCPRGTNCLPKEGLCAISR